MKRISEIKIDNITYIIYKVNNRLIIKYYDHSIYADITEFYKIGIKSLCFKAIKVKNYNGKVINHPCIFFGFDKIEIFSKVVNNAQYGLTL
jgi:hypothetical protein